MDLELLTNLVAAVAPQVIHLRLVVSLTVLSWASRSPDGLVVPLFLFFSL